jgi:dipeptidyl aminopeptidase/acylaminoacyl peptidase
MRRFFLAALALIAFVIPSFPQAKHPFTFEDMMKLKRVGEPEVSPDGKWVIFSVVDVNLEANTKTPHIWIVPLSRSEESRSEEKNGVPHVSRPLRDVGDTGRVLIADQDADRPRWAPDGKRFAFLSTKEGGSQIWVADFDGAAGAVTRKFKITSIATEATGELWSPDGKRILFTSDIYPQCDGPSAAEEECNAKTSKEAVQSKVKAQIFTRLLYRHWNAYKDGKRTHIFVIGTDGPKFMQVYSGPLIDEHPADLTPGDYDAPVFSLGGQDNYAFSPDGKEICYASNHDKNEAASTNNDLWIVAVNGGADAFVRPASEASAKQSNNYVAEVLAKTKNITADNPASDSTPLYSPDGRYIAYRAQQRPGYESDRFRLMLYDRKTGEKKNLTEDFDAGVGTFTWLPDSKAIYFSAGEHGDAPLFRSGLDRLGVVRVMGGTYDDLAFASDGKTLLLTQNSIAFPTRIEAVNTAGVDELVGKMEAATPKNVVGRHGTISDVLPGVLADSNGAVLSQVLMSPLESFWFTGAHGEKVEGFLVKPPNFDPSKKYPIKFLIHGGPQGAWGDDWSYRWNPELFAAPTSSGQGYVVVMINFHGSTGYGQKFIDAINGNWGGAPFEDLMKGLDYAEKTYPFIDKDRECALGASYGGYMINWILGHTDRFKCLVSHDGMFNAESAWGSTEELWFNDWEFKGTPYDNRASYQKWSPHQYAKNFKTPTLVIHGQRDYRLDVSEGFQLFTTLQMEGVPSKMLYFPDEGHWVQKPQNSQLWYKTVNDWVDQWTKK